MHKNKCPVCKNEFESKRSDKIWCSEACYKKAKYYEQHPKPTLTCLGCSKEFIPKKSDQKYCSPICQRHYSNKKYKDNTRFDGYRELIMQRDGYKCVKCGSTKGLIVHHKDESGQTDDPNNDPGNLVTLCNSCHMGEHGINRWMGDNTERFTIVKCLFCGKEFKESIICIDGGKGKYCSKECMINAKKGTHKTKVLANCIICGKEFYTTEHKRSIGRGKYCSKECGYEGQRRNKPTHAIGKYKTRVYIDCPVCGKNHYTTQTLLDKGLGKYCSKECMYKSDERKRKITGRPVRSRVVVNCAVCGKEFATVKSSVERGRGKYCSNKCKGIGSRKAN